MINTSTDVPGWSSYDTNTGRETNWLQVPSYRNGGSPSTHNEYLDNFVVSSEYIGVMDGDPDPTPPEAPTGLMILEN